VSADVRDAALDVRDLVVPFGADRGDAAGPALGPVSLAVAPGEGVALVGPSGAGKTTLLRAVAGLARPRAGAVHVGGRDVTALPPERRDAVYLHQTPVLFPHLDVLANARFPLDVRGVARAEGDARARAALGALRLAGLERRPAHALSGGQRQRVALARAVAARPALLLLDEPLAALDPALRDEVRDAVAAARAESGAAMLLVTHDLDDATALAARVAVLLDGRLAQLAAPAALFARPATLGVVRFLGAHRELPGAVGADGAFRAAGLDGALAACGPDGQLVRAGAAVAACRADAVRLAPADDDGPGPHAAARVVAVRHHARGAVARVALDGAPGVALDAVVAAHAPPAVGDAVRAVLDAPRVLVYPA
jgi:ABC-type Fe3+/spermidine/putrescine transport system ATPase subunit